MACVLKDHGTLVTFYHAGLDRHEHLQNASVVIWECTSDMLHKCIWNGIDKKDVCFIIHLTQSASLEDYVQESGQGGRDGETCHCTLLF
jgi:ATP-dependent DNA helicase RecQ